MRPHLNYQHLRYFWITALEGSLTAAARKLRLSPSTMSAQIRLLEEQLGQELFDRRNRRLSLTERGKLVKSYADDIFTLGEELIDVVSSEGGGTHIHHMHVGVSFNLPKLLTLRLLMAALDVEGFPVRLVIEEDEAERLVGHIATHHLELVLSDHPVGSSADVKARCDLLMTSEISLFASPNLADSIDAGYPQSLDGTPMLLPVHGSAMRLEMESWLALRGIHPRVVAEFGDSALLKAFGEEGIGVFPAPTVVRKEVESHYGVRHLAVMEGAVERVYAVTIQGRKHSPAVQRIIAAGHGMTAAA